MTHKEKAMFYCYEHLESLHLSYCFNKTEFTNSYTRLNGAIHNPYKIGLETANYLVHTYKPQPEEIENS